VKDKIRFQITAKKRVNKKNFYKEYKTYFNYLSSPHWKKQVKLYRKDSCEICFEKPVHLHHIHYHSIGNEIEKDLVTLCGTCHLACHVGLMGKGKLKQPSRAAAKIINRIRLNIKQKPSNFSLFYRRRWIARNIGKEVPPMNYFRKEAKKFCIEKGIRLR